MNNPTYYTYSKLLLKQEHLAVALRANVKPIPFRKSKVSTIVTWFEDDTDNEYEQANKHEWDVLACKKGMIPNCPNYNSPISYTIDPTGNLYTHNSLLTEMLPQCVNENERKRAQDAIIFKNTANICSDNSFPIMSVNDSLNRNNTSNLVIDECTNSHPYRCEKIWDHQFKNLIAYAIKDRVSETPVLILKHPHSGMSTLDTVNRKWLNALIHDKKIKIIEHQINPMQLLKQVNNVYTISSNLGVDAMLLGKKVITAGSPFYAGLGLTFDLHCADKKIECDMETFFFRTYIDYCTYINPYTKKICDIEDALEIIQANSAIRPMSQLIVKNISGIKIDTKCLRRHSQKPPIQNKKHYNSLILRESQITKEHNTHQNKQKLFLTSKTTQWINPTINTKAIVTLTEYNSDKRYVATEREVNRLEKIRQWLKQNQQHKYHDYIGILPSSSEEKKAISSKHFTTHDCIDIAKQRYPNNKIVIFENKQRINSSDIETENVKAISRHMSALRCVITVNSRKALLALLTGTPVYCMGKPDYYGYGYTIDEISKGNTSPERLEDYLTKVLLRETLIYDPNSNTYIRLEDSINHQI